MNRRVLKLSVLAGVAPALGLVLCRSVPLWAAEVAPTPEPGTIVTVAGTGKLGFSGDGGPAQQAQLRLPFGLAVDASGNLYIADWADKRVRRVDTQGIITTFAGGGTRSALAAEGGAATQARLQPTGLVVDREGNLYFSEHEQHRVRKVSKEGIITTVAGTGVRGYSGDGGPAIQARLNAPAGVALDQAGNLYISDFGDFPFFGGNFGSRVRKVSPDGIITTAAGVGPAGFSGDGGPATAAQLKYPLGLAVDSANNLFIADLGNYRVRKVDPQGRISTVAGIGPAESFPASGVATETALRGPKGLAIDAAGHLYISSAEGAGISFDRLKPDARVMKVYGVAAPGLIGGLPFPQPQP